MKEVNTLTVADIPAEVADSVPRVEREGGCENGLPGVLDAFGKSSNGLDDVGGAECLGGDKVCERVGVEHYTYSTQFDAREESQTENDKVQQ